MRNRKSTYLLVLSAICTALLVLGAFLKFPLPGLSVQFTTQVFFVLLIGLALPFPYGTASVICYILLGLIGLPVFSRGGGLHIVLTPEFGYLLGFVLAISLMPLIKKIFSKGRFGYVFTSLSGVFIMYMAALPYIAMTASIYLHQPIGIGPLLASYFLAFLPLDIIKALMAALVARRLQKAGLIPS